MQSLLERFEDKYTPEPNSGCWLWDAASFHDGYGGLQVNDRQLRAHRVSWELHRGAIPLGMQVLHKCDTPACVNPDHLWLGTRAENMADKVRKGRNRQACLLGEENPMAKLTVDKVRAIFADPRKHKCIAAEYSISVDYVGAIKRGYRWGWATSLKRERLLKANADVLMEAGG